MKSTDIFPSNYLRAADLNGREPVVTISHVEMKTIGDDQKLVVYFVGKEKGVVLNKTNFSAIEEISGEDDTDNWTDVRVRLVTRRVEFQGKRVDAIRIEPPPLQKAASNGSKPAPRPVAKPTPVAELDPDVATDADPDDEIPF